jgi:uncharacterized protein YqjF (DUF2071 family)
MAQRWSNLLFAHWALPADAVRSRVPAVLPVDLRDGQAWVSVTPFQLSHLRAHGMPPVPGLSEFPELNVRTYVTINDIPGVYFFSLDADHALAVAGARLSYHLPYRRAAMKADVAPDGSVLYQSRRTERGAPAAEFIARYRPTGEIIHAEPGSLDYFLSERYCLYTVDDSGRVHRAEIHHLPWPLQPAEADIQRNSMGEAAGISLPPRPHHCTFSSRLDVVIWTPERAG